MTSLRVLTLTVGPMTHGGHCVARHNDRVVFVRHAVPGETVRAVVTEGDAGSRFWRADVVDVLEASDHRRRHPWKQADALRAYDRDHVPVGGADYGHISDHHQRRLKSHVFRDTMSRIGKIDLAEAELPGIGVDGEIPATALSGSRSGGLHWRTRVSFAVTGGSLAMKPYRSHDLMPLRSMPLAVEAVSASRIFSWDFSGAESVDVVAPGGEGPLTLVVRSAQGDADHLLQRLRAQAADDPGVGSVVLASRNQRTARGENRRPRTYHALAPEQIEYTAVTGSRTVTEPLPTPVKGPEGTLRDAVTLPAEGFWQIHRSAPSTLVKTVDRMLDIGPGDAVADLYAGAGLFTALCLQRVQPGGRVLSVEAAEGTSQAAAELFGDCEGAEIVTAPVERIAARLRTLDAVVLDPPRAGADKRVLQGIDAADPGQIVYVSCDPASFARDARVLLDLGWSLKSVEILDMYPNTHHMESAALFQRH